MEIHVKPGRVKVDPKRPESHPDFEKVAKAARRNFSKMKFESDAEKRDYLKKMSLNPNNLPGIPNFYPPLLLRSFIGDVFSREYTEEELAQINRERIRQMTIHDIDLYCDPCDQITVHAISPTECYCRRCGRKNRFHS